MKFSESFVIMLLTPCKRKMYTNELADTNPIRVIHLGSLKLKTANELSAKPVPQTKWITASAPWPNII
jgi:hypothetical protein